MKRLGPAKKFAMKRLLLLFAAVGLALFVSCNGEPPEEPEKAHDTSLAGMRGEGWTIIDFEGHNEMYDLEFTENTVVINYYDTINFVPKTVAWSITGTYLYHPPKITITEADGTEHIGFTEKVEGGTALYITLRDRHFIFGLKETETEESK